MRYLSVCSGIEAASVAWDPLGWKAAAFSEIDNFPRAVLAHHYPDVPCHGDFTTIGADDYGPVDLLVGGTPCQSFSIAGLRGGMADDRGNLALEYLRLADRKRPRWLVWENVPGVLSSNDGRDFGSFLGALGELGYGFAYRVLDAQFFGVAQRRRRVFVVGYLGDWRCAAAVLFERHSLQGHPAPRRESRERVAPTISARPSGGGGLGTDFDLDGGLVANPAVDVSPTLRAGGNSTGGDRPPGTDVDTCETLIPLEAQTIGFGYKEFAQDATEETSPPLRALGDYDANGGGHAAVAYSIMPMNSGKDYVARETDVAQPIMAAGPVGGNQGGDYIATIQERAVSENPDAGPGGAGFRDDGAAYALEARTVPQAVAFAQNTRDEVREMAVAGALAAETGMKQQSYIRQASAVRRLTPTECERLQGFPDGYTAVPYRGKPAADGPRYKALGNSMAVPVMAWIGERISTVEAIIRQEQAA